mmetsp:Transcript_16842/g.24651  ORF Transcript_16842/g.24651 Transcript_16842/m.24651 type:complete len:275 (+) Transcript_16842:179-1003(+)|eukprot:CAMPEP_0195537526 /NCGR_PEP_ID=MMETSP0794_2-20130614/48073_1 /TAXON_ID=515487 /ORGANISM="Stephanopyxis turris, Strain CCMP 815" /LENGTH=274 /DNA_ID=CAMNT_0040671259 /DNA_START=70 /DNA_END=894 /DNA_ORIENTATION=+
MTIGVTRVLLNLALSHFQNVNLGSCNKEVFALAGIKRVAFLRHGNTSPSPNGNDFERTLTTLGENQARAAGLCFGAHKLKPFYPQILCSPAPRCVSTANIFIDAALNDGDTLLFSQSKVGNTDDLQAEASSPVLALIPSLYDGTMQPEGSRIFKKHGYAPIREYLEDPDVEDRKVANDILGAYGRDALESMITTLVESNTSTLDNNLGRTLLVIGHAIYLPAAALCLAYVCECDAKGEELILSTNTREAEGYAIDVSEGKVTLLCRPEQSRDLN